jgi:hypothetical protein
MRIKQEIQEKVKAQLRKDSSFVLYYFAIEKNRNLSLVSQKNYDMRLFLNLCRIV